jgi:hypothetical protein
MLPRCSTWAEPVAIIFIQMMLPEGETLEHRLPFESLDLPGTIRSVIAWATIRRNNFDL